MSRFVHILWIVTIQWLVLVCLLLLFGTAQTVYHPIVQPNDGHVFKHLYIDREIPSEQVEIIRRAAHRWELTTGYLASFTVEVITTGTRHKIMDDKDALVITAMTEDDPAVLKMDKELGKLTLAFCNLKDSVPHIAYVWTRIQPKDFEKVTVHELGHAMGLWHIQIPNRVMFPSTDLMSNVIGRDDIEQFCDVYRCDPSKLQYEEETLHP